MRSLALFLGLFIAVCRSENSTKQVDVFRIINGAPIPIQKAPYQTSIEQLTRHNCGGVIIARDIVLTAAHCIKHRMRSWNPMVNLVLETPAFYRIRVGNDYKQIGGNVYKIQEWLIHQNYSAQTYDYDIALIRLKTPIKYTASIQAIEVATEEPQPGEMAIVTGFGNTMPMMKHQKVSPPKPAKQHWQPLMNVTVPVVDRRNCIKILKEVTKIQVTESMICAGFLDERIDDACQGDSGGPMAVNGKLVGLTTWGIGCGRQGLPGVYTNLAKFAEWIETSKRMLHQIPLKK